MTTSPGGRDLNYLSHVLATLPAAVVVVDAMGEVTFASQQAEELVGRSAGELEGRSVLEFVSAETAWAYAAAVAMATDYEDVLMGPLRVSLVHSSGHEVHAELWAANRLDDPELAGITCVITPTSVDTRLTEVATRITQGEPLDVIAGGIARAMLGHPVTADAAVVIRSGGQFEVLGGSTLGPATTELLSSDPSILLGSTYDSGVRQLHADLEGLGEATADALRRDGYNALWIEPAAAPGHPTDALLVVARPHAGNPSPNELSRVYEGASLLALAYRLDRARD